MRSSIIRGMFVLLSLLTACADAQQKQLPLSQVADIPLTGKATRFDYQSLDEEGGRLYIAHLADDMVTVFDLRTQQVIGDIKDLKHVHGVLAVPQLHRIYASATGTNELAVIDDQTLKVITRVPAGNYPDGIAYAAKHSKLYVSDKQGKTDTVIDAGTNRVVATIQLGGQAGNTQYDAGLDRIFVAVHGINAIVEIDPANDRIVGTYPLDGCKDAHGLFIDGESRIAFAACESNATVVAFDLTSKKQIGTYQVGDDPDVLAFDTSLKRLYVSAESGVVTILDEKNRTLETVARGFFTSKAHTVAVDSQTHHIYFPLENVNGKPVLRITVPSDLH